MKPNDTYTQIYQQIYDNFDLAELKVLCDGLGINYEDIPGDRIGIKVRELLCHIAKESRQADLIAALRWERPRFDWPETYTFPVGLTAAGEENILDETEWERSLQNYLTGLQKRVERVRVLGKKQSEPLENIFTHVNVLDKPTAERRYNIHKLIEEFDPRDLNRPKHEKRISGEETVAKYGKLFILGKPGAGKTTFLKHTALRAIKGEIGKTPIFVTLRELSDTGLEIIPFIVQELGVQRFSNAESFVEEWLAEGNVIVLFDGLDEVNLADNKRADLMRALNVFVRWYSDCSILITCRVAATEYSFEPFQYMEMADFDEGQIGHYIERWFADDAEIAAGCQRALLQDTEKEAVRELAQVPLLLSLICVVYEETGEIPAGRHTLYVEATEALLTEWDEKKGVWRDPVYEALSLEDKTGILTYIAAKTFAEGVYFLPEKQVVALIEEYLRQIPGLERANGKKVLRVMEAQHGIFVERARGIHSFSHLTLQEYYAARYIVDNEKRGTVARLMRYVGDDRWREVFLLTAGMLDDATEFGELYLEAAGRLLADDAQLLALLQWAAQKGVQTQAAYRPFPLRAFLLHSTFDFTLRLDKARYHVRNLVFVLDFAYVLNHAFDFNHTFDFDLDRVRDTIRDLINALPLYFACDLDCNLDLDRVRTLAFDLNRTRDLDRAFDLAFDLALALDLNFDRSLFRDLDLDLDDDHDRDFELARDHTFARVRDHELALVRNSVCELAFYLTWDRVLNRDIDFAHDLDRVLRFARDSMPFIFLEVDIDQFRALNLHRFLNFDRALEIADSLGLAAFRAELETLSVPDMLANSEVWQAFAKAFTAILEKYETDWNLYKQIPVTEEGVAQFMDLSAEQLDKFNNYLEANMFLVRCLEVVYMPDQAAIEDRILLPPGS